MPLKKLNKENKLAPMYYGPCKVLKKIGSMDSKLELPATSRVHLVFYVSYLKNVIWDKIPIQTIFKELDEEENVILEPEKYLKQGPSGYEIGSLLSTLSNGRIYQ